MEVVSGDTDWDDFEEEYFVELDFVEWVAYFAFARSIIEPALAIAEFVVPKSTLHHGHPPLCEMKEGVCNEEPDFFPNKVLWR